MTSWEIALQISKFIALAVSAASGVYATIGKTREETGELTPAGRVVLICVILSLVVGLTSQSLETKSTIDKLNTEKADKEAADKNEAAQRAKDDVARASEITSLGAILQTAKKASGNSETSATQSAAAVRGLAAITVAQSVSLEKAWRQERRFGVWKAGLTVKGVHLENSDWGKRILAYAHKPDVMPTHNVLVIPPRLKELYPSQDDPDDFISELKLPSQISMGDPVDPDEYLRENPFDPAQAQRNPNLLGFDLEIGPPPLIVAHLNDDKTAIVSFDLINVELVPTQRAGSPLIRNWVDLYGREMTLDLEGELAAADYISFTLYYEDTNDPHHLVYECGNCTHGLDAKAHGSIKRTLTERELGPFPSDYKTLFPSEFRKIETRIKSSGGNF